MAIRNEKGQLVKGHGGLKGAGRPIGGVDIQNYIRSISNNMEDYIFMLDELVRNPKTKVKEKISCIKELLDRGAGKAIQSIHQTGDLEIVIGKPTDED